MSSRRLFTLLFLICFEIKDRMGLHLSQEVVIDCLEARLLRVIKHDGLGRGIERCEEASANECNAAHNLSDLF